MRYYQDFGDKALSLSPAIFSLGFFDGLHLGHQHLLQRGRGLADSLGLPLAVMAFSSSEEPALVTSYHKRQLFERASVDILIEVPLTKNFKELSAKNFIEKLLRVVPIHTWVAGTDLRFGKDREGSCEFLAERKDMQTLFIDRLQLDGEGVSSTKVRQLVLAGDLSQASVFLSRPYSFMAPASPCGEFEISHLCLPPRGDYAASVNGRPATLRIGQTCYILSDGPAFSSDIVEVTL